jgi:hypothetical protein
MQLPEFPLLQQAQEAAKTLEGALPTITSSKSIIKGFPAFNAQVPKPPISALPLPIKKHPRTCHRASLIKEEAGAIDHSRTRVDSARLFAKLADILPKTSADTEDYDEVLHGNVMDAVASCTAQQEAPPLRYFVRKSYSSPIKGKETRLLVPKPPALPPLRDNPGIFQS